MRTQERWLEEGLWTPEPLVSDGDDLAIRQLVTLLEWWWWGGGGHLLVEVQSNIAQLLLDVTDDLTLSRGCEWVTTLCEDLQVKK